MINHLRFRSSRYVRDAGRSAKGLGFTLDESNHGSLAVTAAVIVDTVGPSWARPPIT
jgi:hypothetical protein